MEVRTTCKKCGAVIRLQFGTLTKTEALEAARKLDAAPRECPGGHVELSGLARLWDMAEAIERAYDHHEGRPDQEALSDADYVQELLAAGHEVIDGGLHTVPDLDLPSIHECTELKHVGFGNFVSPTHCFMRADSPQGTRFYLRTPLCD